MHAFFLFLQVLFIQDSYQQTYTNPPDKIDCYDFDGSVFPNNTQCPGSLTCCQDQSGCLPNRLCSQVNGILVRPTCSTYPWDTHLCSPLCLFTEGTGFLPRVVQCEDGSYCCDNEPACCQDHEGVVLNGSGEVVTTESPLPSSSSTSSIPSTTSTTSTTSSTSTKSITSTTSDIASSSSKSSTAASNTAVSEPVAKSSSSSLPQGTIIGIAVGATALVLISLLALCLCIRHRRKISRLEAALAYRGQPQRELLSPSPMYGPNTYGPDAKQLPRPPPPPFEVHSDSWQAPLVSELPGSHNSIPLLPSKRSYSQPGSGRQSSTPQVSLISEM